MKYLDLFTGIGGFTLGIEQAYEDYLCRLAGQGTERDGETGTSKSSSQTTPESIQRQGDSTDAIGSRVTGTLQCIGFSEIDKYATKIYQAHYPNHKNYGDITKIIASELPDFDLLVGGFPCQAFSIAGKRKGFEDTRGTLFFEVARILRAKQPRLFVLENVKGLLSHDNGQTFATIIATLDELGYDLQWQVLNSKNFGVPQNRERVYIVGHLRGTSRTEVFPIGESERENVSPQREVNQLNQPTHSNDRIYGTDGLSPTLNTMQGGRRQPKVMLGEHRTELGKKTRSEIRKKEGRDSTLRGKDHKEYRPNTHELANCLTTGDRVVEKWLIEDMKIRRLTPTECARLQGFPDDWHKIEGISDTQAYKCYGNAVTVNVVKEVVKRLLTA